MSASTFILFRSHHHHPAPQFHYLPAKSWHLLYTNFPLSCPSAFCLCDRQLKVPCIKQYDSLFYGTSHNTAMAQVFNERRFIWFTVLVQGPGEQGGCQSESSPEHLLAADKKHACVYMSSPPLPESVFGGSSWAHRYLYTLDYEWTAFQRCTHGEHRRRKATPLEVSRIIQCLSFCG